MYQVTLRRILIKTIVLFAALALAGCNKGGGSSANQSSENRNTPTASTPAATQPASSSSGNAGLPVADAVAFRDHLLELARNAKFDAQATVSYKSAEAIRQAWQNAYPGLKYTLFYDQAATPDTVSVGDSFLIARTGGSYDQLLSFAVADTKGGCAAGVSVIPGRNDEHKVSEEKVPTVFKAIELPSGAKCSGDAAGENYKP